MPTNVRATVLFSGIVSVITALAFSAVALYPQAGSLIGEIIATEKPVSAVAMRNDGFMAQLVTAIFWGALMLMTGYTWLLSISWRWHTLRHSVAALSVGTLTALLGFYVPIFYAVGALEILTPQAPAAGSVLAEQYAAVYRANLEQAYYIAGVLVGGIIGIMVLLARYSVSVHFTK
jgi:hypothetical protein